ncbi:hypothetical protein ACU8OS_35150 (plasmid) [Rhizobium leguminosarum]
MQNGFDRLLEAADEVRAEIVPEPSAHISQHLPEIAEYLTRVSGIGIDEEHAEKLLSSDAELVDDILDWGGIDDIEFSMRLLDMIAQVFLHREWPAEDEGINPDEFLFDLRTAAVQSGYSLTPTLDVKPAFRFEY